MYIERTLALASAFPSIGPDGGRRPKHDIENWKYNHPMQVAKNDSHELARLATLRF